MTSTANMILKLDAEATEIVRQVLVAGLSEPARARAIQELEKRARRAAKLPGGEYTAAEAAHPLLLGSLITWGNKEVERFYKSGSREEGDTLIRELDVMKSEHLPKRPPGMSRNIDKMTTSEILVEPGKLLSVEPERQFLVETIAQGRREAARWRAEANAFDVDLNVIETALLSGVPQHQGQSLPQARTRRFPRSQQ